MCLVTGRPIEQPFGQHSDQSTGLFGDEVTNWQLIATHLVLRNSRMAPRRMDKVQLDVALPPAGAKKSKFFEMCFGYDKSYKIYVHWPAGRGEGNGKNKASQNEGKTGHGQCLFVIIIIIVYYFLFWNRLEHKWEEQDKSVWRQDRPQSEPVVHLMQTMSIENINSKKTRQRPTTKNENIWQ